MTLADAIAIWLSGPRLKDEDVIYGIKAIWLGRAGDIRELAGAVLVVAYLLGQKRLREVGYAFVAGKTAPISMVKHIGLVALAAVVFGSMLFILSNIDDHHHLSKLNSPSGKTVFVVTQSVLYGSLAIACLFCVFWLILLPPFLLAALSAKGYGVLIFRTAG